MNVLKSKPLKLIKRTDSVITGVGNLRHLYTFRDFPIFMGCTDTTPEQDIFADMKWAIDPISGIIQLEELIPMEALYQAAHMDGTGPSWEMYYKDLAAFIQQQAPGGEILEIGGGAGKLADAYVRQGKSNWTIIEPNPLLKSSERIRIINEFFNGKNSFDQKFNTIVFSQVLEHIYDPGSFLKDIAAYLPLGGNLIFGHPDLEFFLKNRFTNAINFEHTIFLTDYFVDYLLGVYGFSLIKKISYKHNHFFYHAVKKAVPTNPPLPNKYAEYLKIFEDFIGYHTNLVAALNKSIDNFKGEVYIFGAHIFPQYLFSFGLKQDHIVAILDNSPIKKGKRLYGTNLNVLAPESLRNKKNIAVVLKVGIYRDEIVRQLQQINPEITIFE